MKQFPQDIEFVPVQPTLTVYRQLTTVINLVTVAGMFAVAAYLFVENVQPGFWYGFAYLPAAFVVLYDVVTMIMTPFQVRAHGWVEHDDDLLVRSGAIFRRYEAVPYGRLQFVDVQQGPLQRHFDLANVRLTTAGSSVTIYGVSARVATRLRDDLMSRGYARLAGL